MRAPYLFAGLAGSVAIAVLGVTFTRTFFAAILAALGIIVWMIACLLLAELRN